MVQFRSVGKEMTAISLVAYIVPAAEDLQQCLYTYNYWDMGLWPYVAHQLALNLLLHVLM